MAVLLMDQTWEGTELVTFSLDRHLKLERHLCEMSSEFMYLPGEKLSANVEADGDQMAGAIANQRRQYFVRKSRMNL